jgi:hypothetical protein
LAAKSEGYILTAFPASESIGSADIINRWLSRPDDGIHFIMPSALEAKLIADRHGQGRSPAVDGQL